MSSPFVAFVGGGSIMPCSNGLFFRKIIRIHFGNDVCSNGFFINIFGAIEPILEEKSFFYTHTLTNVGLLLLKTAWSSLVKYGYEQFFFLWKKDSDLWQTEKWFLHLVSIVGSSHFETVIMTKRMDFENTSMQWQCWFLFWFYSQFYVRQTAMTTFLLCFSHRVCVCVSHFSLVSIFHLIFTHSIFPILSLSIGELSRSRIGWIFPAMSDSYRASLFRS